MTASPSPKIVRSVQLTFTGRVATAGLETEFFPAIATHGGRVYFTQILDGTRFVLGQGSLGGGEVVSIPAPLKQAYLVNVSPDGSRLLVREWEHTRLEDPLWVIPTVGGAPRRLGQSSPTTRPGLPMETVSCLPETSGCTSRGVTGANPGSS